MRRIRTGYQGRPVRRGGGPANANAKVIVAIRHSRQKQLHLRCEIVNSPAWQGETMTQTDLPRPTRIRESCSDNLNPSQPPQRLDVAPGARGNGANPHRTDSEAWPACSSRAVADSNAQMRFGIALAQFMIRHDPQAPAQRVRLGIGLGHAWKRPRSGTQAFCWPRFQTTPPHRAGPPASRAVPECGGSGLGCGPGLPRPDETRAPGARDVNGLARAETTGRQNDRAHFGQRRRLRQRRRGRDFFLSPSGKRGRQRFVGQPERFFQAAERRLEFGRLKFWRRSGARTLSRFRHLFLQFARFAQRG